MSGKFALIIGNTEYNDSGLAQLSAPGKDAEDFARVLQSKDICGFDDVKVSLNQTSTSVIEAIDEFFDQKKPDDMLVLYFSGHGVKDESGSLYLAFKNTVRSRLRSTAIKSDYIREAMDQSRSKRQVLILDCCNSGAFPQGTKAEIGGRMGMAQAFQGYGRFVLTASDSTQFAWEGNKVIGETDNSLFTHFLVMGLEGEADSDGDGRITVDELYDYAYGQVSKVTPKQTPTKSSSKQEGEIVLRQNMRIEDIKPVPLPSPLLDSIENPFSDVRLGAVQQLTKLLNGKNLGLARSAKEALEHVAEDDDSRQVSRAAFQALEATRRVEHEALKKDEEERLAAEQEEAEHLARQKIEEEHLTKAKMEAERLVVKKTEAERLAKQKIEEERVAKVKFEAKQKTLHEAAERKATEKAKIEPGKTASPQPTPQRQPVLKWTIIGVIGLCVIATGVGTISYLASLGSTATPASNEINVAPTTASQPRFTSEPDCINPEIFCVGLVTDVGTVSDGLFNQSAWEGLQKAHTDEVADWVQYIETNDYSEYAKNIAVFGNAGYDVIVTVGFGLGEATASAAATYPNVRFIGVDQFQGETVAGVSGLNFPEDNAGFLVGALAAMMSESHHIGAVCGTDVVPPVWRFGEGYKAGAAYADGLNATTTEVFVVYHSDVGFDKTFTDPEWGAQTAKSMIDQGADAIFGCGGLTGNGAITAAAQAGAYAIGVDADQYLTLPEAAPRMLSSAMKLITPGVADLIAATKDNTIADGNIFGAAGYAPFHDLDGEVPAEVKAAMEEIEAGLLNGSITTGVDPVKP